MKLFVDDRRIVPPGWEVARTVVEAIRILNTQNVEEVSLDHDICHEYEHTERGRNEYELDVTEIRKHACGENFSAVAIFLTHIIDPIYYPIKVTIHTTNRDGALNMKSILSEVGIDATWSPALHE